MRGGKTVLRLTVGLGSTLALAGCFGLGDSLPVLRDTPPRSSSPVKNDRDLRIADAPRTSEIPLVPIPLPGNREGTPPSTASAQSNTVPPPSSTRVVASRTAASSTGTPLPRPSGEATPGGGIPPAGQSNPAGQAASPAPSAPSEPTPAALTASQLIQQAAHCYEGIDSYIVRLTRREMLRDRMQPEEVLLVKFRKAPWSVYFKWLGKEGAGREVCYVRGQHDNKIHSLLAAGDIPFMPAGKRMSLAPDNALVKSASRNPITEAGLGPSIERLARVSKAQEAGDNRLGTLTLLGPAKRAEYHRPLDLVEHKIPPGVEANLPRGGRRVYGFDPESHLPLFINAFDDKNQEVEYYCFDRLQYPVKLDNDDFNPDRLWSKPAEARASSHR